MGGRGGGSSSSALGQALKKATPTAAAPDLVRLKPKDLRVGMWTVFDGKRQQIGSIKNKGRAGRNTFGQFEIRDTAGELIFKLSPNGTLAVERN